MRLRRAAPTLCSVRVRTPQRQGCAARAGARAGVCLHSRARAHLAAVLVTGKPWLPRCMRAQVIGKQWLSWCMYEDGPFGTEVAPARRYMESVDEVLALHSMGWLQGGTEGVMLVGFKDRCAARAAWAVRTRAQRACVVGCASGAGGGAYVHHVCCVGQHAAMHAATSAIGHAAVTCLLPAPPPPLASMRRWYDAMLPRFVRDEPVRQEMCSLLGLLALSAKPGHAGIPVGHVVQYKVRVAAVPAARCGEPRRTYAPPCVGAHTRTRRARCRPRWSCSCSLCAS